MRKWLRKIGRAMSTGGLSLIHDASGHHHHEIDHEAVARRYYQMLTCAQRPLPNLEHMPIADSALRSWLVGYTAWYDAAVAPLMKPGDDPPTAGVPAHR
jgi:hypothetical protein